MIFLALVLVGLLAAVLGAFGGRWLGRRALRVQRHELRVALATAAASSQRANDALAAVETIAQGWPDVLERLEHAESNVGRFVLETQAATRAAGETRSRQDQLEQAIRAHFDLRLVERG